MSADVEQMFVMVPVPTDRVTEVYALLSKPTDPAEPDAVLNSHAVTAKPRGPRGEIRALSGPEVDRDLVVRMYAESLDPHRRLMEYLADHEGEWLKTKDVAAALKLRKGARSLVGMLGAFGRRAAHRYDHRWPFAARQNTEDRGWMLRMDPAVAEIIREVKNEAG